MALISRESFLKKYNIDENKYYSANINWNEMIKIYDRYVNELTEYEPIELFIVSCFKKLEHVHSIRSRIKDPEHLIEKTIRRKIENANIDINENNYQLHITDLIGIRILHLYKDDWENIHDFIIGKWDLAETPVANVRAGYDDNRLKIYEKKGCIIKMHPYGYRSIHYLINSMPYKNKVYVEIQVRTIFEEGWSEVDHAIRYPYYKNSDIYNQFLDILNNHAGAADNMCSFLKNKLKPLVEQSGNHGEFEKNISSDSAMAIDKPLYCNLDHAVQESAARAMFSKALTCGDRGNHEEELKAYDELIGLFKDSQEETVQESVARAMFNKGVTLKQQGNKEEALKAYDELIGLFKDSQEAAIQEQVAKGMFNKAVVIGN